MTQPDERGYVPDGNSTTPPPPPAARPGPPPLPPRPVMPLEYGHEPGPGRPSAARTFGRIVLGSVGYIIVSACWFGFAASLFGGGGFGPSGRTRYDLLWMGWGAMTLALLGLTLYLRLRYRIKGYGYGILTALALVFIGIPLLILGICFYSK